MHDVTVAARSCGPVLWPGHGYWPETGPGETRDFPQAKLSQPERQCLASDLKLPRVTVPVPSGPGNGTEAAGLALTGG